MRRTLAITLFLLAPAMAQTTWVVPNGTSDLTPYINQAAPGDILLLTGQYNGFTLNKGLTLIGPATFGLNGSQPNSTFTNNTVQIAVPPGQEARLVDVTMRGLAIGFVSVGAHLVVQQGQVALERVAIDGGGFQSAGAVKMIDCTATGLSGGLDPALSVTAGVCTVIQGALRGANESSGGGNPSFPCRPGVVQSGGLLHVSNAVVTGGSRVVYQNLLSSDPTAWLATGGIAFLSDSTLTGGAGLPYLGFPGTTTMPGGAALAISGGASVSIARTTLTNGSYWTGSPPPIQPVPDLVGMSSGGPPVRGQMFTATAKAGASPQLLGFVGGFDGTLGMVAPFPEPLCGQPGQLMPLAFTVPAAGAQVPYSTAVPNVIAFRGVSFWVHALQLANGVVHASPPAGGTIL